MSLTFLDIISLFAIYSFAGWCTEVIYATMNTGKFVNRGFLNGPLCPIYGFGVVIVVLVLDPLKGSLILLFLGSVLLTTALELITGAVLEKFFMQKWWDYTDEHYNFKGYICLKFSVLWGLACVFVILLIQPGVMHLIRLLPYVLHVILLAGFYLLVFTDLVITLVSLLKLKKQLTLLKQMDASLDQISELIGSRLSDGTIKWMQEYNRLLLRIDEEYAGRVQEQKERLQDELLKVHEKTEQITENYDEILSQQKQRISEKQQKLIHDFELLKVRYENSVKKKSFVHLRIRHAFPKLKLPTFGEMLEHLEEVKRKDQ